MRASDIKVGSIYKHRSSTVGYAQAIQVLPPNTGENTTPRIVVLCAWATEPKFEQFAIYKYFRPADLVFYTHPDLAQLEQPATNNFCPVCGKRNGVDLIHTCTPPFKC